jgi:hypothetical protein
MFGNIARLGAVSYVEQRRLGSAGYGFILVPGVPLGRIPQSLAMQGWSTPETAPDLADASDGRQAVRDFVEARKAAEGGTIPGFWGYFQHTHLNFIRQELPGIRLLTLLCDPARRVVAEYRECAAPDHPSREAFRRRFPSLRDFALDPGNRNRMARRLAGEGLDDGAAVLDAVLRRFELVGIAEWPEMSLSMLRRLTGATELPTGPADEAGEPLDDTALRDEILAANPLDAALYDGVRRLLEPHRDSWAQHESEVRTLDRQPFPRLSRGGRRSKPLRFHDFGRLGAISYVEAQRKDALWGFSHVPKTAGTSLVSSLSEHRPPYWNIAARDYSVMGPAYRDQEWAAVRDFVARHRMVLSDARFRSFSGHLRGAHSAFIREYLPDSRLFTLIREPVERVISDYRYCLTPSYPRHEWFARQFPTILDFAHHHMGRNIMVQYLAPNPDAAEETIIPSILDGFEFIGCVELYELSVAMIFRMLGVLHRPTLHLNATSETDINAGEIDDATRDEIRRINALDDALYNAVRGMLEPQQEAWWAHFDALKQAREAPAERLVHRRHPAAPPSFQDIAEIGAIDYVESRRTATAMLGFSHVPKTAGTSIIGSLTGLKRPYRNIEVRDYTAPNDEFRRQEWEAVTAFVEQQRSPTGRGRCRSFSGHLRRAHVDYIRTELPDVRFFTLLRDPVARVVSDYRYCLTPKHPAHEQFAEQFPTLSDFAQHPASQNLMAKYLAEDWQAGDEAVIESVLAGFDFIGVMEMYEMSVSMVFRMADVVHVSNEHRNQTVPTDRNALEIEAAVHEEIRRCNAVDSALYQSVRNLLEPQRESWWAHFALLQVARQG